MAQGDMIIFDDGFRNGHVDGWDWDTDTFNIAIVDNTTSFTTETGDPAWGTGGSLDVSANEVSTTGTQYTGPEALTGVSFTEVSDGVFMFDAANPGVWSQDASGFTDGYYAVIYNNTATVKRLLCAIDLGGPISLVGGSLTLTFHANGIFRITRT